MLFPQTGEVFAYVPNSVNKIWFNQLALWSETTIYSHFKIKELKPTETKQRACYSENNPLSFLGPVPFLL